MHRHLPLRVAPRALLCALLALSAACLHARRTLGPDGVPLWFEVKTPNFTVRAAATEADARAAAARLERIRAGLLASSWHAEKNPLGRVEVLVLERRKEFQERYHFPALLEGAAFADTVGQLRLLVSADEDPDDVPVLKHELAHAIAHGFLLREPLWLAEGLATYLETLKVTDDAVTVGTTSDERLRDAYRSRIPFSQVMKVGADLYDTKNESLVVGFYGRAWLLVHLLQNRHREGFEKFILRLARAEEPASAFAAGQPGRPTPLDALATAYAATGQCDAAVQAEQRVLEVLPERSGPEVAAMFRQRVHELGAVCRQNLLASQTPVPARRLGCKGKPPLVPAQKHASKMEVRIKFRLLADGNLADLHTEGNAPAAVARPLEAYVKTCTYLPASQGGVAVESVIEELFAFAGEAQIAVRRAIAGKTKAVWPGRSC